MSNFQKTEKCYVDEKYEYKKSVEQQGHELWYQKVTNPRDRYILQDILSYFTLLTEDHSRLK
ncbi:MAG: hypothetical protein WCA61_09615, partial [Nitrososphaeraceae archaeon]